MSNLDYPIVVSFGGGTNSTAMLCGFRERGITPALILFADTGGEKPETYAHVRVMSEKCQEWWGIEIGTVRTLYQGKFEGLEGNCLRMKMLPGLAYGHKSCSQKYKIDPQDKRLKKWMDSAGVKAVIKAIGFDADEPHRSKERPPVDLAKGRSMTFWYPLVDWGWSRAACVDAIKRHGIPQPGKSSCFFCPAMKRAEIVHLKKTEPKLFERALRIEANAELKTEGRGLGGQNLRWETVAAADDAQAELWDYLDMIDPPEVPCGCVDG